MATAPAHFRPEIDGLRAVAVLLVLLFHAGLPGFHGAFVGVDVFFVISGYLISGILLRETAAGTFSFTGFYERRVRRIMPALLTMLTTTALLSLIMLPEDLVDYAKSLVAAVAFVSNFYFWKTSGYFGIDSQSSPLLHTWSLAVEEQLYIVIPFLLVAISARFAKRGIALFIAAGILAAVLFGLMVDNRIPHAGFFWPVFRSGEFLLGALIAVDVLPRIQNRWINEALAAGGLLLIASDIPRVVMDFHFPLQIVLTACAGTALFIYGAGSNNSFVTRAMRVRPMVLIGKASYSLYLWHWPIIAFGTYYFLDNATKPLAKVLLALLAIPVAFLSWRYVEQPFRGRDALLSRRAMFLSAAAVSAALAIFALSVIALKGLPGRFDAVTQAMLSDTLKQHNPCGNQSARDVIRGHLCVLGDHSKKPSFIVWGDSHADMYYEMLDREARKYAVAGYIVSGGACRAYSFWVRQPGDEACAPRNAAVRDYLKTQKLKAIVIIQRWRNVREILHVEAMGGSDRTRQWRVDYALGMPEMNRLAQETGAKLFITRDTPEADAPVMGTLAKARILGISASEPDAPAHLKFGIPIARYHDYADPGNALLDRFASNHPVTFLDPQKSLCSAVSCRVDKDGYPLYRDEHHLNRAGAEETAPAFAPLFKYLSQH